jgi:hypothetical protein
MASSTLSEPASVSRPRANGTRDARQACSADLPNAVAIRPILLVLPSLVSRYSVAQWQETAVCILPSRSVIIEEPLQ